ncbi:MAG: hypothetical protein APG12_01603 [Candidatus Methanofastidiosum methylothiophilum]|uniref:Uncharacterized protein n=1 Tax=Candidatus Methanofastidiosum methylothiophilum TaxID=1705564 RepID=A0A150IWA1_9EURY|nr:MAG: hypothetical protein APG10_00003 [Candidatus Methanofastidiosum methylthiophilus]KYC46811.1 MAG: hypothetical protein APG11_01649 [Candidatus Methanofastidiosum methylthiophilus]KYC49263.1 MAG: hypothetical protein APG12_01603 [Candidatus Methanofastidiosum methylthiophilus]
MGRDKTYLDLVDLIKEEMGDAKTNATTRKTIESALAEISTKYGVGAAHKAYDACKLEALGIAKPI